MKKNYEIPLTEVVMVVEKCSLMENSGEISGEDVMAKQNNAFDGEESDYFSPDSHSSNLWDD